MNPDARERPAQSSSGPTGATKSPSLQSSVTPFPLPLPIIPDYEVLKRIGGGSYGDVWLARSLLGTWRAVKVVYRNSFEHDKPFEREFKGIQRFEPISLMHESQVKILHVGRNHAAGYFYYVMELADPAAGNPKPEIRNPKETRNPNAEPAVASDPLRISSLGFPSPFAIRHSDFYTPRTLKHELQQRGRLPVDECIGIGLSLTTALAHLHEHGLVHRDIKPSNIIFVNGVSKLADIGLVTDVEATRSFVGTEGFIPPEGPGTAQADLYSLGKVLYEMSMGRSRLDFPALPAHWDDLPEDEQAHLLELNELLVKACESDPRGRYQTVRQMQADLERLQRGQSVKHQRMLARRFTIVKKTTITAAVAMVVATLPIATVLKRGRAENPEARRLYELGRWHYAQLTDESLKKGIKYLTQATEIDPNFAPAYVTLFEIYCWNAGGVSPEERTGRIRQIASKLLTINPKIAEGHAALSTVQWHEGDRQSAKQEIQLAIKLNPNYANGYGIYGYQLAIFGRAEEAHKVLQKAQQLDPTSRIQATVAGYPFLVTHDYDGALAQFRKALDIDTNFPLAHFWTGKALEAKGEYLEAIAEFEKSNLLAGEDEAQVRQLAQALRQAYTQSGPGGYWLELLKFKQAAQSQPANKGLSWMNRWSFGAVYAKLDEKEKALEFIEKAVAEETFDDWDKLDPCFDGLRDDSRFKALAKKARLSE